MPNYNYSPALITPVLAAGSASSPFYYLVNISQKLCSSTCAAQSPVFNPVVSMVGISNVGTSQYVATIHVEGVVAYVPCASSPCCTRTMVISQDFTVPFFSAAAPTAVTVTAGVPVNSVAVSPCQTCSRNFVCELPMTLTVTTA